MDCTPTPPRRGGSQMKMIRVIMTLICAGLLVSCRDDGSMEAPKPLTTGPVTVTTTKPVEPVRSGPDLSRWEIHYVAVCVENLDKDCPGQYGIALTSDSHFEIGPGPDKQSFSGEITEEELNSLKELLSKMVLSDGENEIAETCVESNAEGPEENIALLLQNQEVPAVKIAKSKFCFNAFTREGAETLHRNVQSLARKYYPVPFPNPCIDAAAELEKLFEEMRICERDEDCAYVDDAFLPVNFMRNKRVLLDDCTYLKPLVVANGFSAVSGQLELLLARQHAEDACGSLLERNSCSKKEKFDATAGPPVCVKGSCHVNPGVKIAK